MNAPQRPNPVNLDLLSIKFTPNAIASISHRISGIVIFIMLPLMLWAWQLSLQSEASYTLLLKKFSSGYCKLVFFGLLAALVYHALAGTRHMLMDIGIAESKQVVQISAIILWLLFALAMFFCWLYLW